MNNISLYIVYQVIELIKIDLLMIKYMEKNYKWLDIFLEIGKMKLYE